MMRSETTMLARAFDAMTADTDVAPASGALLVEEDVEIDASPPPGRVARNSSQGEARKDAPCVIPQILVIDDDPSILSLIVRIFESEPVDVRSAENGYQAIDLLQQDADVSVVILDWCLPGMKGEQVFDKLVAIRPSVKVIVSSAENPSAVESAFSGRKIVQFVPKPFQVRTLVTAVKSALTL